MKIRLLKSFLEKSNPERNSRMSLSVCYCYERVSFELNFIRFEKHGRKVDEKISNEKSLIVCVFVCVCDYELYRIGHEIPVEYA